MTLEREQRRLAELHEYQLLDTPPQEELEAVVRVAAAVAGVPTATLNLIDDRRQCQLTTVGFRGSDSDRTESMCAVRLDAGRFVHLQDARVEPDYRDNPWVSGVYGSIAFYASAPLITPGGSVLGTLCVFDSEPHELTAEQISRIQDLADILVAFFERRRHARLTAELAAANEARQQWTETLMDTIDVAVIAVDPGFRVTLYNRAARDFHDPDIDLQAGPVEVATRYALYEPDGRTPVPDDQIPLVMALSGRGPVTGRELTVRRPGNAPRRVRANAQALHGDSGEVLGAVVALQDVTAEWSRRRLLELARERLAAANAELRRSNADLTNFAGAVSHDLVAPLAAVGGYLELLADEVSGRGREWVDAARRAVARMRELITALLDYARAGSAPVRRVRVSLGALLDQVLLDLHADIEAAGARVTAGPLPELSCDPVLVRQLLQNLIVNAVKYRHPDRPCRIAVAADGDEISVADNGAGVPAELRRRVFDMFTRFDTRDTAGQGIGLSSCLRIVDRHGGDIRLEENTGGGATVTFTLPEAAGD